MEVQPSYPQQVDLISREAPFRDVSGECRDYAHLSGALTHSAWTGEQPDLFAWSHSLRIFFSIAEWFQEHSLRHSLARCVAQCGVPYVESALFLPFALHNENLPSRVCVLAGTSAVAGDSSLAGPVHGTHYPLEWTYGRDRGSSPCSDCDRGCVDRRWFARRDERDQRHGSLP